MPGPVNLDVRNFSSGGADGYKDVTASNGQTYSYKYTGGDDTHGNSTVHVGGGLATIVVSMHSDQRYSFTSVSFDSTGGGQFSWQAGGSATVVVIHDTAVAVASVKYTCNVRDSTANCNVPCDPMIQNVP